MGSVVQDHNVVDNGNAVDAIVPKAEPAHEGSSSSVSTPDAEGEPLAQDVVQTQKRKGGRKPIYATSEERKQRNRQAQAAFRERRTEYIKQLETTIKHNEDTLQTLQQSHRSAADECLMLRYKNSLLERILLEKGIDVQAELRLKNGSPNIQPTKPLPPHQNSPLQRAAVNRQSTHRHQKSGIAPKLDQNGMPQPQRENVFAAHSPQLQPTPSSHVSSPSAAKSPGFALQGGMSPTGTDFQAQQQQQPRSQLLQRPRAFSQTQPTGLPHTDPVENIGDPQAVMPVTTAPVSAHPSSYYPSPFQKHYDQLGKLAQLTFLQCWGSFVTQEYDAQADMVDEPEPEETAEPSSYVPDFNPSSMATGAPQTSDIAVDTPISHVTGEVNGTVFGASNPLFEHFEPMLDADPFGLTASMHFQTPFSYEQTNARQ
ncbi:hypothetical protein FQN54_004741 [Arachnomyces sp. PD_36]|nr:hypothetical protein FQN54_004741 [Arachnomyces sp. PD_36]